MLDNVIFTATRDNLPEILAVIRTELEKYICDEKILKRLELVCEEILCNIIDYAYPGNNPGKITLTCFYDMESSLLRLMFIDDGVEYNPLAEVKQDDTGLGIQIYTTIMDEVNYKYRNGQNILIIDKILTDPEIISERKKIAILIHDDFYNAELSYYKETFTEAGFDVHLLGNLLKNDTVEYTSYKDNVKINCNENFAEISAAELKEYAAVIVPDGYVASHLRETEDLDILPPASAFLKKCFADKTLIKGFLNQGVGIMLPIYELLKKRRLAVDKSLLSAVELMGAVYVNENVIIDDDIISASGKEYKAFAQEIISLLNERQFFSIY